jgi:hypothetical protein
MFPNQLRAFRERSHTRIHKASSPVPLWGCMNRNGRNFTVEPILFVGERRPGVGHARIALMGGLSFGTLGKLKAIVGVVSKDVRLFHTKDVGTELLRRNPLTGS